MAGITQAFKQSWDLGCIPLLLYIAILAPLRIGFDIDASVLSFGWILDQVVDLVFIVDLLINFRSALGC